MKRKILLLSAIFTMGSYAEDNKPFKEQADIIHDKLSMIFGKSIAYVDNFVFRKQELDKDTGSRLYIFNRTSYTNDGIFINDTDFRLNLRLPRLAKSLQFSLEGNNRNQNEVDGNAQSIRANNSANLSQDEGVSGQLNYYDKIQNFTRYKLTTGVNINTKLKPFIRGLLFREDKYFGYDFRPYLEYTWTHIDGRDQAAGLMIGKNLTNKIVLRWFVDQAWEERDELIDISFGPGLFHQLSKRRAINYNFRYVYEGKTVMPLREYEFIISYRQNLYKDWFYAEGGPFISFKRINQFEQEHGAFIKFELAFGRF